MSFYKLPPPWNPGYVIPDYVQAEPPERGTFTTRWLPRGTIPALIPDYLAVPAPQRAGSSLAGSSLGQHSLSGTCFDDHSLSGDALGVNGNASGASFSKYGMKVAKNLIARVQTMPQASRGPVLKKMLAAIDKTLPARAEAHAKAEMKRGVPAPQALKNGIATAVSRGAVGELATLGRRARASAQSGSLRGLGRTHTALGALASLSPRTTDTKPTAPQTLIAGMCGPDGTMIWRGDHWEKKRIGETCGGTYAAGPNSGTSTAGPGGGIVVTDSSGNVIATPVVATPLPPAEALPMIQVGPFQFPKDSTKSTIAWHAGVTAPHLLPEDWQAELRRLFTSSFAGSSKVSTTGYQLDKFVSGLPSSVGNGFLGLVDTIPNKPAWLPIFKAKHPVSGKDYGVFISMRYAPANVPIASATDVTMNITWAEIGDNRAWYEVAWDFIKSIVVTMVDVVADAVVAVKDATCSLLQQPGVDQAALVAAAKDPSLTSAGVTAGVIAGQQLCGGAVAPVLPPIAPASGSSWLLPVAALGGGVLLIYALTQR